MLVARLGDRIINIPSTLTDDKRAHYEQNVHDAMATMQRLLTGIDVNVKFKS
jgi:hypothetical protein